MECLIEVSTLFYILQILRFYLERHFICAGTFDPSEHHKVPATVLRVKVDCTLLEFDTRILTQISIEINELTRRFTCPPCSLRV